MAGFFQQFLKGAADGFFGDQAYLRDFTHASKTFRTNAYGNAPKFKWLFHVYFDINTTQVTNNPSTFPSPEIPGLLVKNISLPRFTLSLAEMNQYNRKRYVQTKINYDPVSVTFHDDNDNSIRQLWFNYYSYYYNDPTQPTGNLGASSRTSTSSHAIATLNMKNTYNADNSQDQNWGYLGEPSNTSTSTATGQAKAPFFKSIRIYGFNQHNFALYELVNPIIEKFDHDDYNYYETTGTMENRMTLRYETVKYSEGALNGRTPSAIVSGFGSASNYDTRLSPISIPGSNRNILGQGGLVDAGLGAIEDLSNGNFIGAIQKTGTAARTFKNSDNILRAGKAEVIAGVLAATSNPQTVRNVFNIPAPGASTGTGSQVVGSRNIPPTSAPPVSTPANNPITGP